MTWMHAGRMTRALMTAVAILGTLSCTSSNGTGPADGPSIPPPPPDDQVLGPIVVMDAATRYQTISGWEATAQAGQDFAYFPMIANSLIDMAVNDVGITRLRLEIYSGAENDRDYWTEAGKNDANPTLWTCTRYSTINDNDDPFTINASGFHFSILTDAVTKVVLPMKAKLEARGERLHLNVTYVAFVNNLCAGRTYIHNQNPEEYAEFVLATHQHLRSRYNLTPNTWELILEPNSTIWTGQSLGRAGLAAANRLRAAGFSSKFIAPSFSNISNTFPYFDEMLTVQGLEQHLAELSYHRYGGASATQLQAIASRAAQLGINTGMLEHIGSDYHNLHQDLTVANVSAWQQFTLAYNEADGGGKYIRIDDSNPAQPTLVVTERARYLRQYFRYVRPGAVRIRATSADAAFNPVAFINSNGKYAVVIKASRSGTVSLQRLPAGLYGVTYAIAGRSDAGSDIDLTPGRTLNATIPAAGVLTVYRK